ncbi:MAG: hypothetical protein MJZ92_05285 [Paludibacteraceae bacterium]|nr:hypothetical protein [Paludibacteraceae bacterium]
MAIGLLCFGSLIVAFAVWVEPSGELHASVLTFYGETLTGILLLLGIPIPKKPPATKRKKE